MSLITTRVVHERAGTFPSRSSSAWLSSACICSACAAALAPAVATHWWSPPDAPPNWSRRSSALSSALHLAQRMIRRRCFVVFGQGRAFSFFYLKIAGVRCLPPNCRSRYTIPRPQIKPVQPLFLLYTPPAVRIWLCRLRRRGISLPPSVVYSGCTPEILFGFSIVAFHSSSRPQHRLAALWTA